MRTVTLWDGQWMAWASVALLIALAGCAVAGGSVPCVLSVSYDPTTGAFEQSCRWTPPSTDAVIPTP